jgi:hypothetical protein
VNLGNIYILLTVLVINLKTTRSMRFIKKKNCQPLLLWMRVLHSTH